METFQLRVNGKLRQVQTDPMRPLLEVIREDLGLTGTKYGCGEGQCRACTVLLDGKATPSCITPIRAAASRKIVTVEGLAVDGKLTRIQQSFADLGAMQCGYCTPGMVLTATALLERTPNPTEPQIVEAMNGNLCRCCGYNRIVAAILQAASAGARESNAAEIHREPAGMRSASNGENV